MKTTMKYVNGGTYSLSQKTGKRFEIFESYTGDVRPRIIASGDTLREACIEFMYKYQYKYDYNKLDEIGNYDDEELFDYIKDGPHHCYVDWDDEDVEEI